MACISHHASLHIAIIGCGFSGSMVAVHLLRLAASPLTLTLVESQPRLGRGIAYGTDCENHLLNVPAGRMSAFADDPDHFLNWCADQNSAVDPGFFAPRQRYGTYLQAVLETAVAQASAVVRRQRWQDEAVGLSLQDGGAILRLKSGQTVRADRVVLALGHFPPNDPEVADHSFYRSRRYIGQPWSADALKQLPPEEPVLLIGSGLTAVDLVLALQARAHQGPIHVVSRHGRLPQSHRPCAPGAPLRIADETPATVRSLLRRIRQEIAAATETGRDWRAVIDALRPETPALWQALPPVERRRFLRHVRAFWENHRHRAAPEVIAAIEQLRRSGQLRVHAGRIRACEERRDRVRVCYQPRRDHALRGLSVGRVINCTGPESDYRKLQQPLIVDLLASGLIRPDPLGLGLDTDARGRLLDARGRASAWLYTLGPPCKGRLWETTAVPEIRGQAEALARRLLAAG